MTRLINPDQQYFDNDTGAPLALGTVYFGEPNQDPETNPKAVYADADLVTPLSPTQALTAAGKHQQAIYLDGEYSITVRDSGGSLISAEENFAGAEIGGGPQSLRSQLASPSGPGMIGWTRSALVAGSTIRHILDATAPNVWEFASSVTSKPSAADPNTWDWQPAIQECIDTYNRCYLPGNNEQIYCCGADIVFDDHTRMFSYGATLRATADGINLLNLDHVLYAHVSGVGIDLAADNVTAIKVTSDATGTMSQLNIFEGIRLEGNNRAGTVAVLLDKTFTNIFRECFLFRTADGVIFGRSGAAANSCNANHFYGCEIRSDNTNANSNRPVIHRNGDNNGFFGGVIENWKNDIFVGDGAFFLRGVYIEAFSSAFSIRQEGGHLLVDGCFRVGFIGVYGGKSITVTNNQYHVAAAQANITYPLIQMRADVATKVRISGNQLEDSGACLYRAFEWLDGSTWKDRAAANEVIQHRDCRFQARKLADQMEATGDGTEATVIWGTEEYDYEDEFAPGSGIFTSREGGVYQFAGCLYLDDVTSAISSMQVILRTTDRDYYGAWIDPQQFTASGEMMLPFTFQAKLKAGQTARLIFKASGTTKTVDLIRGDAATGYNWFAGHKV